ncbi:hypothetical protein Taro_023057 [Colocasia esculenta]|uniref:Uncharacterized protein n=1 Tax=Colocasia esculenta TaxID=4460 RepID=A0A843UWA2_COLES|nr:hypothetical protein [Colocasia esculenta]
MLGVSTHLCVVSTHFGHFEESKLLKTQLSRLLQKKTSSRWIASRSEEIGDSVTLDDPFEEGFQAIRVFFLELKQKSWSPFLKQK